MPDRLTEVTVCALRAKDFIRKNSLPVSTESPFAFSPQKIWPRD